MQTQLEHRMYDRTTDVKGLMNGYDASATYDGVITWVINST